MDLKTIVGLYTYSLDSKAAAALLKYYSKSENTLLIYSQHGSELPLLLPHSSETEIISLGVNIPNYKDYKFFAIENDGKTSAADALMNLSFNSKNPYVHMMNSNVIGPWVDLIKRFHVRTSCYVDDEAFAFHLITQNYDTFPSNMKQSYFWTKLIEDPSYFDYLLKEGKHILQFKQKYYPKYNDEMFPVVIKGKKCLVFNKRYSDSSGFLSYPGIEDFDYLIAFQDRYRKKKLYGHYTGVISVNNIIDFIKESDSEMVFTVYRNKPTGNAVEFISHIGGKGHAGVSTFTLENRNIKDHCIRITDARLHNSVNTNNEEQEFIESDTISPNVKKYKASEIKYTINSSIALMDQQDAHVVYVSNNGFFPYQLNSICYVNYTYDPTYIHMLLNTVIDIGNWDRYSNLLEQFLNDPSIAEKPSFAINVDMGSFVNP